MIKLSGALLLCLWLGWDLAAAAGLPPDLHRRLGQAREMMDTGRHREAVPRLRELLRQNQGDAYAEAVLHQHLAYACLGADDPAAARGELDAALRSGELSDQAMRQLHLLQAQTLVSLERPAQALPHLQAWLASAGHPTPEQRAMAAQIYYSAGRHTTAVEQLELALAQVDEPPESWTRSLLAMYLEAGRDKQARALLKRLIQSHPGNPEYWRRLAQLESARGRRLQALNVMALAYRRGLLDARELIGFAQLHAAAGMPEKAARLLRRWRESGKLRQTLERLRTETDLWLMARERDQALDVLERAAGEDPSGRMDFQRGRILFDLGRWAASSVALRRALDRGDIAKPGQGWLLLGIAALNQGETELAESSLKQALNQPESRDQAEHWLRALALRRKGSASGG